MMYVRDAATGDLRFVALPAPTTAEVEALVVVVAKRAERWLSRRGHGLDDDEAGGLDPDAQQVIQGASVAGSTALSDWGARRAGRVQVVGGRVRRLPPRCATFGGYTLHAGVHIRAGDRSGLERLCRYVLRPPLAKGRLEERPDGNLAIRLRRPWSDGSTAIVLSPMALMERLAALVPPPHKHQILYSGVFAPRSSWRSEVVRRPETRPSLGPLRKGHGEPCRSEPGRWWWADLLMRVFGAEGYACPRCGARMRLRTVAVRPPATSRILGGLERAERRSRGPPLRFD